MTVRRATIHELEAILDSKKAGEVEILPDGSVEVNLGLMDCCDEAGRLKAVNAQLLEVLEDWERTPGNHRDSTWWHAWEDKRRAAISAATEG